MGSKIKEAVHEDFEKLRNDKDQYIYTFCQNNYDLVYKISLSVLKNEYNSQDVTQNVFEKLLKMPVEKYPTEFESSWLYTVVKNEALQFIRNGNKVKNEVDIEEIKESVEDTSNDFEKIEQKDKYEKIVKKLEKKKEQIVSLKVVSGFTFEEIGQMMSIPTATVQWNYYASMKTLKVVVANLAVFVISLFTSEKMIYNQNEVEFINEKSPKENEEILENSTEITDNSNYSTNKYETVTANNTDKNINVDLMEETQQDTLQPDKYILGFNVKSVKLASCVTGIFFIIIIFCIFFKKTQQKIKIKSSKK